MAAKGDDISRGIEMAPVCVENTAVKIDAFQYVPHVICGPGIDINFSESMYPGCSCTDECNEMKCPCILRYSPNYDRQGHFLKGENTAGYCLPIFECNSNCSCPALCTNRLSQQGIKHRLQIFQTEKRGLGVKTLQPIRKRRYICEYSGEIVSYGEAKRRATKIDRTDKNYMIVLKEHVADGKVLRTHIDASTHGNVARFMNHSCQPNMDMFPVRINSPVPRLCLLASRDIDTGEELTFSYGNTACKDERNDDQHISNFAKQRRECLCGSSNCVGYLPFDERLYAS